MLHYIKDNLLLCNILSFISQNAIYLMTYPISLNIKQLQSYNLR